jgi:hypothetical protein
VGLKISRQAICDVNTGDVFYSISIDRKAEWSVSSKSLVKVTSANTGQVFGKLHFHSFEVDRIDILPSDRKAFYLKEAISETEWSCIGYDRNQR